ncbi:hypothetical protein NM208_g8284 [Fusarium decemcellulare]|uniref:Uncharacterized protein n=1 Tax=Fusarium decemcellulare TaxID=57161 RepID=A0ACC1S637_9HYPO|nr:hypothetical protein NM208_g8284 [Fusarium decemcellulare]
MSTPEPNPGQKVLLQLKEQWANPGDILSVLLIVGDDVIQKALAQLSTKSFTPVAISLGWVAYAYWALLQTTGRLRNMPEPDLPSVHVQCQSGVWVPPEVKQKREGDDKIRQTRTLHQDKGVFALHSSSHTLAILVSLMGTLPQDGQAAVVMGRSAAWRREEAVVLMSTSHTFAFPPPDIDAPATIKLYDIELLVLVHLHSAAVPMWSSLQSSI